MKQPYGLFAEEAGSHQAPVFIRELSCRFPRANAAALKEQKVYSENVQLFFAHFTTSQPAVPLGQRHYPGKLVPSIQESNTRKLQKAVGLAANYTASSDESLKEIYGHLIRKAAARRAFNGR